MRRAKYVCPLSVLKTGSLPPRLIKVTKKTDIFNIFFGLDKHSAIFFFIFTVIQALVALVNDPEPEHPLRAELAEEFLKDRKKFTKNAEEFTKKHSEKRPTD